MKKRTIKEAIVDVMKKIGYPLSSREIYKKILEFDYYRFRAEDPKNIVQGEIRRHCEGVNFPTSKPNKYFQILNNGTYWLKDVPLPQTFQESPKIENKVRKDSESIKQIVSQLKEIHTRHTTAFKKHVLNQLKQIDPKIFENFSKKFLEVYGFKEVSVTRFSKDGGIDGNGKLKVGITFLNVAFQCKRWKDNTIGRTEIDKFRGAIQGEFEQGILFTTSTFSEEAKKATIKKGCSTNHIN